MGGSRGTKRDSTHICLDEHLSEKQDLTVAQKTFPLFPLPEINICINHSTLTQDSTTQHQATEQGISFSFFLSDLQITLVRLLEQHLGNKTQDFCSQDDSASPPAPELVIHRSHPHKAPLPKRSHRCLRHFCHIRD